MPNYIKNKFCGFIEKNGDICKKSKNFHKENDLSHIFFEYIRGKNDR